MTDDRVRFTDDQAAWSKASCVKRGYWKDEVLLLLISTINIKLGPYTMHTKRAATLANHSCYVFYATQTGRYNVETCDRIEKNQPVSDTRRWN